MNVLLSILYCKSIELTIKSKLLLIVNKSLYKNISPRKSHLLVLLFVKLLPAMRFTNASKQNTIIVGECLKKFQLDRHYPFYFGHYKRFSKFLLNIVNNSHFLLKSNQILLQSTHYTA